MKAFTLLELLFTIAIVAILLMLGIGYWQEAISRNRMLGKTNDIIGAIKFAQSLAIKMGIPLKLCASANHKTCGENWNGGQIIVMQTGKVLRILPALPKQDQLLWHGNYGNNALQISPVGIISNGSFTYCAKKTKKCTKIVINSAGRIREETEYV